MSEEEKKPKAKSKASKIIWAIVAIVCFVLAIYYILKAVGMF